MKRSIGWRTRKRRSVFLGDAVIVMMIGLVTRRRRVPSFPRPGLQVLESQLGKFLVEYSGDTLWAFMMYLLVSSTLPSSHVGRRFTVTLMIAFLIEFSQLYHAP